MRNRHRKSRKMGKNKGKMFSKKCPTLTKSEAALCNSLKTTDMDMAKYPTLLNNGSKNTQSDRVNVNLC